MALKKVCINFDGLEELVQLPGMCSAGQGTHGPGTK